MDRRAFGKLAGMSSMVAGIAAHGVGQTVAEGSAEDWKSGQDSPVHDADRLLPLSQRRVTMENAAVRISFDERTGGMTEFFGKKLGWNVLKDETLAESFRLFVPTPERAYNPVIGARNFAASVTKSVDGNSVTLIWKHLVSEYSGTLDITLTAVATLHDENVEFDVTVDNRSKQQVASVEWPILGGWTKIPEETTMRRFVYVNGYSGQDGTVFWPRFTNEENGCGVSFPMQDWDGFFALLMGESGGLYVGSHDQAMETYVRYTLELKPGWLNSGSEMLPRQAAISGHPMRLVLSVVHYPFAAPGESVRCRHIAISAYKGSWHKGVDVFKRWQSTWYKAPAVPEWSKSPMAWAQIQINSSEDDLRTSYKDLPRRGLICAKAGIEALQITGWNHLGQDRNNPSHDTDPRLGTHEDFKAAIARIEKMGVRVILFNKYTWADSSTEWYRNELERYMVKDPNGCTYQIRGYKYQTPVQLANINTRRLISACQLTRQWQEISRKEFQKVLDLGSSGMLYDEVAGTGEAHACFDKTHEHRMGAGLTPGSFELAKMFRQMAADQRGEGKFLFGGEGIWEGLSLYYSLSYIRIHEVHTPAARYINPYINIMMAITGFDDREMINSALRFRYLMSFEPFIFKGNPNDYPSSMSYGMKVEAFRKKHREWVWDAEFLGTSEGGVDFAGAEHGEYSVFRTPKGKYAAVIANNGTKPLTAKVTLPNATPEMQWATPEAPELQPVKGGELSIAPRGTVLVTPG